MTADAPAAEVMDERAGAKAERLVVERVRAALPPEYRLYPNVRRIGRTADLRAKIVSACTVAYPGRILITWWKREGAPDWYVGSWDPRLHATPEDLTCPMI